jgi:hypothetical protein
LNTFLIVNEFLNSSLSINTVFYILLIWNSSWFQRFLLSLRCSWSRIWYRISHNWKILVPVLQRAVKCLWIINHCFSENCIRSPLILKTKCFKLLFVEANITVIWIYALSYRLAISFWVEGLRRCFKVSWFVNFLVSYNLNTQIWSSKINLLIGARKTDNVWKRIREIFNQIFDIIYLYEAFIYSVINRIIFIWYIRYRLTI